MIFSLPAFAWIGVRASRGALPLSRRDWLAVIALGLLGYYGASILDFAGLQYITAGLERLILFTYPTLALLLGALLYGQAISRREWIALGLCYLGIGAVFAHDLQGPARAGSVLIGAGLVFGSSVCYAFYLTGSSTMLVRVGVARLTALALLVSTVATLLHFAATLPLSAFVQPWPIYAYALAMALLSTVIPVFAQAAAIRRIGSGRAALIGTLGPLMTIGLGWIVLGEAISLWQMAGAALVVAGVVLVGRQARI
jgi:drug/metabolite transporter (DMT)-like permease